MNWIERDKNNVWHPFTPLVGVDDPLLIKKAEGVYLITEDNKRIIDAVSSWWVNLHGHGHPDIAKAISDQAYNLEHIIFAGFTHKPAVELAECLLSILPANQDQIFYSDNGSTAVEAALKLAFQYWFNKDTPRSRVIAIDGSYHGDTFGAMSVGERGDFTRPFFPHLFEVDFIDFPTKEKESDVLDQFCKFIDTGEIASFIYEPLIQGAAGMRIYSAQLLDDMIGYAQKHDVICIADEVMTGFGRTGKLFASDYMKTNPDILCLSKGITGGAIAMGATSCSKAIVDSFKTPELSKAFLHGHSYTGNPMACAAALASYKLLINPGCQSDIQRIAKQHQLFVAKHSQTPILNDIRSLGTILALEFKTDSDSSYLSEMRNQLYPFFLKRNILLRPLGNLLYVIPPYIISNEELGLIYEAIEEFLNLDS